MWKSNFYFLEKYDKELFELCEGAEIMLSKNSNLSMLMLRQFVESLCRKIISKKKSNFDNLNLDKMISYLNTNKETDSVINSKLNYIRRSGNKAAHDLLKDYTTAAKSLEQAYEVAAWYYRKCYSSSFKQSQFSYDNLKNIDKLDNAYLLDRQTRIISSFMEKFYNDATSFNKDYLESIDLLKEENKKNIKLLTEQQQGFFIDLIKQLDEKYENYFKAIQNDSSKLTNDMTNIEVKQEIVHESNPGKNKGIGDYVKTVFIKLSKDNLLTKYQLVALQDKEYTKIVFDLSSFPVLKKFDRTKSMNEQRFVKGHPRFYDLILKYHGDEYLLCSQWIKDKHYKRIENWLIGIANHEIEVAFDEAKKESADRPKNSSEEISEEYLMRLVRTIGMNSFIKYYDYFKNNKYSEEYIIELFDKNEEHYANNSAKTKAYAGKKIFREGMYYRALRFISNALKVDSKTRKRAQELLEAEG